MTGEKQKVAEEPHAGDFRVDFVTPDDLQTTSQPQAPRHRPKVRTHGHASPHAGHVPVPYPLAQPMTGGGHPHAPPPSHTGILTFLTLVTLLLVAAVVVLAFSLSRARSEVEDLRSNIAGLKDEFFAVKYDINEAVHELAEIRKGKPSAR